nr:MAG TPA: minor tail protein [Caudoviricetes sp.]
MASRQNLQIEVPVKLKLTMQDIQSQIKVLRDQLKNISPDSEKFKGLQRQIESLEKASKKMAQQLEKPFKTQSEIKSFGIKLEKLTDNAKLLGKEFQDLDFGDLLFSEEDLQKVSNFGEQIKKVQASIEALKKKGISSAKESFSSIFTDAGITSADNYEKVLKKIESGLEKAEKRANSAKEALTSATEAESKTKNTEKTFKKNATQLASDVLGKQDTRFFDKLGRFKNTGRKNLQQEMVNIGFDEKTASELVNKTKAEIKAFFENISKEITDRIPQLTEAARQATSKKEQAKTNYENAQTKVSNYQKTKGELENIPQTEEYKALEQQVTLLQAEVKKLKQELVDASGPIKTSGAALDALGDDAENGIDGLKQMSEEFETLSEQAQKLENIKTAVKQWFGFSHIINTVKSAIKSAISTIRELDSVMTEIAVVTDMTQKDLWAQMDTYSALAQKYGTTIKGAYQVSQLYYQQGLQTNEVMELTEQTLIMAKISGLDYATATDYMTVAVRGFKMEMSEASTVTDVYSNIAAKTASNTTELAVAMSKVASGAEAVGANFQSTTAMLATMISVTREAPENLGSALKSIVSRYGELKSDPKALVDSEGEALSLNNVDKALQSIGITLQDVNGEFRDFDDVIMELSSKWETLDKNSQRYIATVMAGNRQQSRFLALVSNYDLLKQTTEDAYNSEDQGLLQMLKTMDSLDTKINQFTTSFQQFYTSSGIEQLIKYFVDFGTDLVNYLNGLPKLFDKIPIAALSTLMNIAAVAKNLLLKILATANAQLSKYNKELVQQAEEQGRKEEEAKIRGAEQARQNAKNGTLNQDDENPNKQTAKFSKVASALTGIGVALQASSGIIARGNTQLAQAIGGTGSMVAGIGQMFTTGIAGKIMGAVSIISGLMTILDGLSESVEEKVDRLKDNVDKTKNELVQSKDEYKTLTQYKKKYEELAKSQYDSVKAKQEFLDIQQEIAAKYPELISGMDSEGNYLVSLTEGYNALAKAKHAAYLSDFIENSSAEIEALSDSDYILEQLGGVSKDFIPTDYFSGISSYQLDQIFSYYSGSGSLRKPESEDTLLTKLFGEKSLKNIKLERVKIGQGEKFYVPEDITQQAFDALYNAQDPSDARERVAKAFNTSADKIDINTGFYGEINKIKASRSYIDNGKAVDNYIKSAIPEIRNLQMTLAGVEEDSIIYLANLDESLTKSWKEYSKKYLEDNPDKTLSDAWTFFSWTEVPSEIEAYYNKNIFKDLTDKQKDDLDQIYLNLSSYSNTHNGKGDLQLEGEVKKIVGDNEGVVNFIVSQWKEETVEARNLFIDNYNQKKTQAIDPADVENITGSIAPYLLSSVTEQINYAVRNEEKNPEQAQQALHALFSLYNDDIIPLGAEAERIAATADLTSLTGISQFFKGLEEAGFDTSGIDLTDWKETLSVNLPTEWKSFEASITSNLKDLEDSLKDVSSGMNLEDAISMVQKVGLSLNDDFLLKDGKYFLKGESISKVRDAYVEQYQELYGQIEEEQQKQIEAIKSFQGDWTNLPDDKELKYLYNAYYKEWEKTNKEEDFSSYVIKQLEAAQEEANTIANEYADYQVKVLMLVNGQIKLVLTELFGEGSTSIEKVITAIKTKDFSNLTSAELETISPYLSTIQDNFIDFTVDTLSTIADGLDSKDLIQATDVNRDYLNELVDDGVLNKVSDDWYQVIDGISEKMFADAVYAADLTVKETNEILAKSHDYFDKSDQQDALKDVEFYSEQLAYASWDTIRALSDSLEVEMNDLADMNNQDKYGNYRLKLDEAEVSSLLMSIKNGPEIIAENTISKLDEINKWLEDGIGGKLNLSDKSSLIDNLSKLGIQIDPNAFTQTVDGFKLAQSEAYRVLTTLQSINSLAGKVMLSSLVESAMDSDERLNDIFYVMRRIDELNKEINNAKPGSARREELEGELAVCKEITAELKKADGTFNFMDRDLPSGYDDPLSAWEGIGDAFKVLDGDDFKKNQIGYQDFYNMINFAGDEILAGAKDANGNLITASDLLDAGAQALVNVDGETFVDLSKLGANFNLGATNMKEGLTKGIHTLAQNQIDMLDAEIAMLETVVQTQEAFDKVAGDDNVIDFSELLPTYENGEFTWTSEQQTIVDALGQYASGLKLTLINGVETTLGEVVKNPMLFALINKEGRGIIEALANALNGIDWSLLSGENAKLFQDKINASLVQFGLQITIDPSKLTEKIQVKEGKEEENPLYQKIVDAAVSRGISKDKIEEAIQKKLKETDKTEITAGELIEIIVGETDEKDKETVENYLLQTAQTDFSEVEVPFTFTPTGKMGTPVVTDSEGKELTGEEVKNKLNELFSLDGDVKVEYTEEVDVEGNVQAHYTFNGKKYTEEQVEKLQKDIMAYQSAQNLSGESSTTSTETDIEIVPQKIYIKEDSGALGEDGSLLITDPIAKATATVTELEIDPTGAKTGMKQAQGAVNSPIEIEITDEITGKASTLTITPSTTPTLELGEETPTVSDVSATAESATVKPTSYQVDLTDSEGNTQSVTVDGTANLETVISGLTKDENGNYSIDSVNGIAQVSAEVSQADTSIQTLWDKWSNKEITFTVKPQEESEETNTQSSAELRKIVKEKKWSNASGDNVNVMLKTYKENILSTVSAIQQLTDLGIPVSQEDIQFIRDLQDALTASYGNASQGYPTVEALGELADKCVQLNNVSPTVLATANTLSTMDLAQTATYLADMVTNAESLIELEFTNFADLETATETAKTTVDSIATKLAEMTGRTITINVVEQQNGNDGEGGNSTYTTTYSFNTDNLTSAVTSIQNASNNATTAIEKVASAMDEIPTDSSKAKAVSDTGKSIKNLPDKKTVGVVISQPKTTSINAVATLTVKVQGEGSVVSGIFEKKFSAPVGGNIDMSRAKGNVALAKGTKTLMGELGPELVVSNGHYFVAGENGAEFVNLADDAIVFNHLQTKKLLQNGNAGRGMAVTNEKKATSMATGNAMASASDALAELKRIRAMWQALLDSSASDLGKKAGSGGGGGGGGGKGDDPKAITHDLERWYNLLRQIAKAEQQITLEQAKRKNMQSGYNYSDSLEKELATLKKQEQAYRQLASIQEDWYNIRRKELLDTDFSKVFTYDKDGLMQYVDGVDMGLDILAKLNSTDKTGAPTGVGADSQAQINYLKSIGFDVEKYLRTNDDGTKAENTDDMMQNFWDRVDGWKDELDGLYDEYNDHLKDIEENVASQNEILQEYIDNQLSVEEKLLNAIVDRQQAQIDKMQDLLDATQNASEEYIKGLTDALNKEQQLYNKNQNDRELSKLQRQLAILQRSGGSASEIKNLQNQIDSKLQSDYFDAMQKQIDAIQEASDNQIEKLQKQIDIATEALEYQKENGLLWQEVYQMMNEWTPEKMLEFIEKYTHSYREDSGLQSSENSKETKKELEIWANKRDMNARDEAWKKYYSDAKYDDAIKKNYSASAQEAFNAGYASGGAEEGARRANEIFENAKKNQGSSTGGNIGGNTGGSSTGSNTTPTQTEGTSRGKVKTNTGAGLYIRSKPDLKAKKVGKIPNGSTMEIYDDYKNSKWYKVRYNGTTGYSYKQYIKKYAQGGLVDYTGPAWVDGSKSKPEAFLSAKDTALLKSKIFSDSNFSLRSCIEAIQALADNFRSISTDNSENINIENISIQVGNGTISSDYSARKAGQEIMDEILNVAKKAGNLTLARR